MMRYIRIIIVLLFPLIISAQKSPIKVCEYKNNDITIRAEIIDNVYNYNDLIEIKMTYRNNTSNDVYIFDTELCTNSSWNTENHSYIFDIGGDFWTDLGIQQHIYLKKIFPKKEITATIRQKLYPQNLTKLKYGIMESWYDTTNMFAILLEFHIGYIKSTPELSVNQLTSVKPLIISNSKQALLFEQKLNRVFLGPLLLKIKN